MGLTGDFLRQLVTDMPATQDPRGWLTALAHEFDTCVRPDSFEMLFATAARGAGDSREVAELKHGLPITDLTLTHQAPANLVDLPAPSWGYREPVLRAG